jgi:hypothetical protein
VIRYDTFAPLSGVKAVPPKFQPLLFKRVTGLPEATEEIFCQKWKVAYVYNGETVSIVVVTPLGAKHSSRAHVVRCFTAQGQIAVSLDGALVAEVVQ